MSLVQRAPRAAIAASLCALLVACGGTRHVIVDRYDVALTILADGSLEVQETIVARASQPDAQFVREIPSERIDGIVDVEASRNGSTPRDPAGQVDVDRSGAVRVRWPVVAGNRAEVLNLRYKVVGALAAQGPRGLLQWSALPSARSYSVAASRISLTTPPDAIVTAGPSINDGRTPASRTASGLTAELVAVAAAQPVTIDAEIILATGAVAEPQWQVNAAEAWRLMPAFLSGGACLIVIAIGVVVMTRLQYSTRAVRTDEVFTAEDPSTVPPSLVAAVINGRLGTTPTNRRRRRVDHELCEDLLERGLAEKGQLAIRTGLRQTGLLAIGLAVAGAIASRLLLSRFGIWPMAMPIGLAAMGGLFLWAAGRVPFLTPKGIQARIAWRSAIQERLK